MHVGFLDERCVWHPDHDMGLLNSLVKAWMLSRSGHDCSRRDFNPTSEQLSEGFSELKKVSLVRDGMGSSRHDMGWFFLANFYDEYLGKLNDRVYTRWYVSVLNSEQ